MSLAPRLASRLSSRLDSALARLSARNRKNGAVPETVWRQLSTPAGTVRLQDTGGNNPCVVLVPDGPNVLEHYRPLIALLSGHFRVVCFDMPGFGHSLPAPGYAHSLDQGAAIVIAVLDELQIASATLAFSCANGLYALRVAQRAPQRVLRLVLSQTPSLAAMHAWSKRVIPSVLHVPVLGQAVAWASRHRAANSWYRIALPKGSEPEPFKRPALHALASGGCFCLAGVVQGLGREHVDALAGVSVPCTMVWGGMDRSHRLTDPKTILELVPHAEIICFDKSGHFPDIEEPERFAKLLMQPAQAQA